MSTYDFDPDPDDYGREPAHIANAIKKLNFRESFEAWHKARYGFIGKYAGTAMHITYQTSTVQQRWEGWQACAEQHSKTKF